MWAYRRKDKKKVTISRSKEGWKNKNTLVYPDTILGICAKRKIVTFMSETIVHDKGEHAVTVCRACVADIQRKLCLASD